MAERVRARRLSDEEGRQLQQIVRRGKHGSVRVRRALIIMASASGTPVPAIARLVQADEDTVRQVIHRFNEIGLACLDPRWAGGRPRRISPDQTAYIVATALTRPEKLGLPFTRWSVRKLADYLAANPVRMVTIGRERLRQILRRHKVSFQRTRTWKESTDPEREAKLDRIEAVTTAFPQRCFAFDQFGPLVDPPAPRRRLGAMVQAGAVAGHLPAYPRHPLLPRLLQPRRRPALGRDPPPQGRRPHVGRAQDDPGRPARRRADLRHPRQPVREQDRTHPGLGQDATRSSCASPRPTRPGPTRSRPNSGRYARSRSAARTTAICLEMIRRQPPVPTINHPGCYVISPRTHRSAHAELSMVMWIKTGLGSRRSHQDHRA